MTDKKGGSARRALQRGSRQVQPAAAIPAEAGTTNRREGKKRITVDLPKEEHRFLRNYTLDHETDGMRVVRGLLLLLRRKPELSEDLLDVLPEIDR